MSRLQLDGLAFLDYGPVDLRIDAGECASLRGASGSGKSLLLRAIADLDPHEGDVRCDDLECRSVPAPAWRRRVGLLPAESQWWLDSVGKQLHEVEAKWLERLGFDPAVLQWSIARLSTGERQRLALLRLLANRPAVLLLDEPTANLDAGNTTRIEGLVTDYRRDTGAAVLWVTHDANQARRIADHHYRIMNGRVDPEEPR